MEDRAGEIFVGRAHELGVLERALTAAQAGAGTTALVAGEAGIGKTRLATELGRYARTRGFQVLLGRSIDLIGTELPYQPIVDALRPLGELERTAGSQLRAFEQALTLLSDRAVDAPVLLVLEDLHWADTSTLDLVVFLAHNIDDRRILLLATYRTDELSSAVRIRRLAQGVRRSGAAMALELGPLEHGELTQLLLTRAATPLAVVVTDAIVARSEGNPFFAEELLFAAADCGQLPHGVRDLMLQRVARLDRPAQSLLRVAAAAGREVAYALLQAVARQPDADLREGLRQAVEHGVLVADQASGSFRFRHALLAEAIYGTILPGEREELHARLAEELTRNAAAAPAELSRHWAAAGRRPEAMVASIEAARQAEAVFGLAEALAHLERALALWPAVPNAADLLRLNLAELCSWTAELAAQTGAAPRAVELARRAIDLTGEGDVARAATLHERLARYLHMSGRHDAALKPLRRAVEMVPTQPPSRERAQALAALGHGLNLAWRYEESCRICLQALALARAVGAPAAEHQALTDLGVDLAYVGRGEEGLAQLLLARQLAEKSGDPSALQRAYVTLSDVLMMLARPREAARLAGNGLDLLRRFGRDQSTLVANRIEALVACGEWDDAERISAAALRAITANSPHQPLLTRAELEVGRGDFDAARAHLEAAKPTVRGDPGMATYYTFVAELALWERRWTDVDEAVDAGLRHAGTRDMAQIRVWLCAKGLRAQAELAALARLHHDATATRDHEARATELLTDARQAAGDAAVITPHAHGWRELAEAEHERGRGVARPELWSGAADTWERLERPPLAAYCRWRQTEALLSVQAPRAVANQPLRQAYAVASRIKALPLLQELELLAERARLDPTQPEPDPQATNGLQEHLGLTLREAEVLLLVARGLTNREIAAELVISAKTASVHVSHILRKLDAPNRLEAAAITHRLRIPSNPAHPAAKHSAKPG